MHRETKKSKVYSNAQSGEEISLGDSFPMGVFFYSLSVLLRMPTISLHLYFVNGTFDLSTLCVNSTIGLH